MNKILNTSFDFAFAFSAGLFAFVPESAFGKYQILKSFSAHIVTNLKFFPFSSDELSIVLGKLLSFIIVLLFFILCTVIIQKCRQSISIKGKNYCIRIMYGDIMKQKGMKVISFDECFTTKVGNAPEDIKPSSVCGQYLKDRPIEDIQSLIDNIGLKPERKTSEYKNHKKYKSGSLMPRDDALLMAFAKLNKDGLGFFASREEYLDSLNVLWSELDKHYNQQDVYIPVLGAGVTRIGDVSPTQQELVDMIIYSYKLSPHKIKSTLCVVCQRSKDFSLTRVGCEI